MKSRVAITLTFLLLSISGTRVEAQQPAADTMAVARARVAMTSDLRNLATAQEAFFSDRMTYSAAFANLASTYRTSDGVNVALLSASQTSHAAIATHRDTPGLVCAISVNTPNPVSLEATDEGRVVCRLADGTLWRYTRPAR